MAMQWTPLPTGDFTGIDWAKPGATRGFDPYLVWAEADRFAGFGKTTPQWLSLVLELTPATRIAQLEAAASPRWLRIPPVYTSSAAPVGLRFCTAHVRPEFFAALRPGGAIHGLVQRFELGMSLGDESTDFASWGTRPFSTPKKLLGGKVLGLIDGGLAFAQANFLRAGKARTQYFWRQDEQGFGPSPAAFGYGHELTAQDIDRALARYTYRGLVDEESVYRHFQMGLGMDKLVNHGTHVMDLAGGPRTLAAQVAGPDAPPSWAFAHDDASRAPIVAVQLDWDTIVDTSGGSMNVRILDGLMYILSRCKPSAQVAVNLSWGTLAGPHDGTSVLEAAMDALISLRGGLQIVLPVSNSYQSRTHANVTLAKNEHARLHWRGQPSDATQNYLELWVQEGCQGLQVEVTPPGRDPLPPLAFGESAMWTDGQEVPLCALIYPETVATGTRGTCALVAVAPTFSFSKDTATAPSGVWQITLTNRGKNPVTVDAYVERDDEVIGVRTGARQSHLEDRWYDTSGNPDAFVDHPDNPSLIRRSGNYNSIATGRRTVSVGGTRLSDGSWALYSARRPDPDRRRTERPGVVKVPETEAPSDENRALLGVGGAGTRSGSRVRLVGTSSAAPQITRARFNAM